MANPLQTPRSFTAQLHDTPLANIEKAYRQRLIEWRYAVGTQAQYLSCVVHFGKWMAQRSIPLNQVCSELIHRFLTQHLPRCHCDGRVQRHPPQVRAALLQLLPVLLDTGLDLPSVEPDAVETELDLYDTFMRDQRGLANNTRNQRRLIVSELLRLSLNRKGHLRSLTKRMLHCFISTKLERWSPASSTVMIGAVRSYLRFRALQGDDIATLLPVIASPANWRLSTLPETISSKEVELLLNSFKPPMPSRRRGAAIAQCVARLGLRANEVVGLKLDDIDWHNGTVLLRRCKSRRSDLMPMPVSVGAAIAEYLHDERPDCISRRVFVRHVAPVEKPLLPSLVGRVIRDAYHRCDLPYTRVHIFRHSLAARVLDGGGTLKEVADILRHRSLDTAQIYAKLDDQRLEAVAMHWPGSSL